MKNSSIVAICVLFVILVALIRLCLFFPFTNTENVPISPFYFNTKETTRNQRKHIMVLLGSGGHTGEMLRFWQTWDINNVELSFVVTEPGSLEKAYIFEEDKFTDETLVIERQHFGKDYLPSNFEFKSTNSKESKKNMNTTSNFIKINYIILPRARNVNQSYVSSIFSTLYCFYVSFKIICFQVSRLPDMIFCNGPGTSVPLCYLLFLVDFATSLKKRKKKIIYIESLARVEKLSLSGILLYPIATRFIVQWRKLSSKVPRAEYHGILV